MLQVVLPPAETFNAAAKRSRWPVTCDAASALESPRLAELHGVWTMVKGDRAMPRREDFTARVLARQLRDICFVECAAGRYRFRYFGSGLASYTGDCTGKFLDEVIPPATLDIWVATYEAALGGRAALRFVSQFASFNLEHMRAESLLAPLCDEAGKACGLLIGVAYSPRFA